MEDTTVLGGMGTVPDALRTSHNHSVTDSELEILEGIISNNLFTLSGEGLPF